MGACATKPIVLGDAPLPLDQPAAAHDPELEVSRNEEEVAGEKIQQETPAPHENSSNSLGDLSENEGTTGSAENVVLEAANTPETATPKTVEEKEEMIDHKETDEAVEEQPTEVSEPAAGEAVSDATPEETAVPSQAANTEETPANAVPAESEEKAQVQTVESSSAGAPAAGKNGDKNEEKKGDVFHALFTVYNNLINNNKS